MRNLVHSPKKSSIILILQTLIIILFFLGNAVLHQSNSGLKEGFIDNFTGDAMVKVPSDLPVSIFGAITPAIEEYYTISELPVYERVKERLISLEQVDGVTSLVSGSAYMSIKGYGSPIPIFGIAGPEYFDFFSSLQVVEGSKMEDSNPGVFVTLNRADKIEATLGRPLEIGESILLNTYKNGIFRIREVPLLGIIQYENAGVVLNEVVLVDAQTLRALNQVSLAIDDAYQPEASAVSLLGHNLDMLFGESSESSIIDKEKTLGIDDEELTLESLKGQMSQKTLRDSETLSGGGWHFILIRFSARMNPNRTLRVINDIMTEYNLEAVDWRMAAGFSAFLILLLQVIFNGGFILVVTASVIAVINILVISVIERKGEIGTLRAIGASRGYVRRLLITENLILSLVSGLLAIIAAIGIIFLLNNCRIELSNSLLSSLFGDTVLIVNYSFSIVSLSVLLSIFLGITASWFPTVLALRIQPVQAISQES